MIKRLAKKGISVILCVLLFVQSMYVGVYGANYVYINDTAGSVPISEEYSNTLHFISGTHSLSTSRAGTFTINDYTLIPALNFDIAGIASNIYPVNLSLTFNSPVSRIIKGLNEYSCAAYGLGWLPDFGMSIFEVEYTDSHLLYLLDAEENCTVFELSAEEAEEDSEFFGMQKWTAADGTIIWKTPDNALTADNTQYILINEDERYFYDSFGRLKKIANTTNNAEMQIIYADGENIRPEMINKITDGTGNEYRFTYNDNNQLTKIKCYNSSNEEIVIGTALETNFAYTGNYLTSVTFPDGEIISFTYDSSGNITSAVNIDLDKIEMTYQDGVISSMSYKAYDEANEEYVTREALAIEKTSNLVRTFTDLYGHKEIKTFTSDGEIVTITDENGNYLYGAPEEEPELPPEEETTEPETDDEELEESLCPCADCEEYLCSCECEAEEECECVQCKRTSFTTEDSYGNVLSDALFDGVKTLSETNTYNANGSVASSTDSAGNTVYYLYNSNSGVLESIIAGETQADFEYDAMGNLLSFSQDVSGLSNGTKMENSYTYEHDKLKTITHNGFSYEFSYDIWGNQSSVKINDITLASNTYGEGEHYDRLSEITYANGQSVSYSYNSNGDISGISYDGGETNRYAYEYDENGTLLSCTDFAVNQKTVYTDNATQIVDTQDNTVIFSTGYDEDGNEIETVFGSSVTYEYDYSYSDITGITVSERFFETETETTDDETPINIYNSVSTVNETDWFGRTVSKTVTTDFIKEENSVETEYASLTATYEYTYDDTDTTASSRVTSYISTVETEDGIVSQRPEYYEYDDAGNITALYTYVNGNKFYVNTYEYDEAGQLIREDLYLADATIVYAYDKGGNMISKKVYDFTRGEISPDETPDTVTFGYDHPIWKDVLTSYNGEPVTYDAMGNITSLGDYSYTWTGGRQLKSVTSEDQHFEYFYNADGKLEKYDMYDVITSQPINGENTETIRYSGTVYYFWNEDSLVSMCLEEDGQLLYNIRIVYDADGEAMGICLNDRGTFLYQKDLQGDIVALISPDGQIVLEYIYDSYGNFSVSTPDNSVGSAFLAMFILALNPLSYRGYLYAPGIGVSYYLGSRFYSPEICRFMNADVYQDTGTGAVGTNMFAYCDNNPVMNFDPTGYATSSILSTAVNSVKLVILLTYIYDYAITYRQGFDTDAFYDYIERITTKKTTFSTLVNRLQISAGIISKGRLWALPSDAELLFDLFDILGIKYTKKLGGIVSKISFATDIFKDVYNPYLYTDQVTMNLAVYLAQAAAQAGATTFVTDAVVAATAASGNPLVGIVVGVLVFFAAGDIINYFSNGVLFS